MTSFLTLFHRSALVRVGVRGIVLALGAVPLIAIALKLQPAMPLLRSQDALLVLVGLIVIESTFVVAVKLLFRKVQ